MSRAAIVILAIALAVAVQATPYKGETCKEMASLKGCKTCSVNEKKGTAECNSCRKGLSYVFDGQKEGWCEPTCYVSRAGVGRPTFCQKSKCECVPGANGGVSSYNDDQFCDDANPAERGCKCPGMCCALSNEFPKDVKLNCKYGNKKSEEQYPCVQNKDVNTCAEVEVAAPVTGVKSSGGRRG